MNSALQACEGLPVHSFAPGTTLIREGDPSGRLLVLREGEVIVLKGEVQVASVRTPGAIFGEMSILLDRPTTATVVARTTVQVHVIEEADGFLGASPAIALHTARMLAQRLHDATTYLADLKRQFEDEQNHLGMVDRILGSLLNQQLDAAAPRTDPPGAATRDDPRL
jgi:CRP-like cAMP-binding protein